MHSRAILSAVILAALWLILNAVQAEVSPLWADELYYTAWAQQSALYYFDHPPLMAWSIRVGQLLFPGAWGVRLPAWLYHAATLFFVWKILGQPAAFERFMLLGAATLLFHVSGFLAVPDSPYLLGCAGFLFFLQRFFTQSSRLNGVGLGLAAAWTVMSKYHGWLFLALCLLPHSIFLLRRWRLLILPLLICTSLIMPVYATAAHHGFETLRLHLGGRHPVNRFPQFTLDFLAGWLGATGLWLYPYGLWRMWPRGRADRFTLSLLAVSLGFPLLVLLISFFSSVEANWAAPALLTLLLLLSQAGLPFKKLYFIAALAPVWVLSFSLRFLLLTRAEILAPWRPLDFTPPEMWVKPIRQQADTLPVVFLNSYQLAAAYSWYTDLPAWSLNNFNYRRNQYDVWQWDTACWGKPVYFVSSWPFPELIQLTDKPFTLYGKKLEAFYALPQIRLKWVNVTCDWEAGKPVDVTLELINAYKKTVPVAFNEARFHILVTFWQNGKRQDDGEHYWSLPENFFPLKPGESRVLSYRLKPPERSGRYLMNFCLRSGWLESGHNSTFYSVHVKP